MNIEFHYYILHYLCQAAGFSEDDAGIIACSSQFVDSNVQSYKIETNRGFYHTRATQNYVFWDSDFEKYAFIPFHFFPGDLEKTGLLRKDRRSNPLCCTAGSSRVKKLLLRALKTRNLYRIGIALHTYADSWAHQNFSGRREEWNRVNADSLIPPVGHAQVLNSPDIFNSRWEDTRLKDEYRYIKNSARFIKAARMIYKYLRIYNRLDFEDTDFVMSELEEIIGDIGREKTVEERICDIIIQTNIAKYDPREWTSEALNLPRFSEDELIQKGYEKLMGLKTEFLRKYSLLKESPVTAKERFFSTHFYRWTEAAEAHLKDALDILQRDDPL